MKPLSLLAIAATAWIVTGALLPAQAGDHGRHAGWSRAHDEPRPWHGHPRRGHPDMGPEVVYVVPPPPYYRPHVVAVAPPPVVYVPAEPSVNLIIPIQLR